MLTTIPISEAAHPAIETDLRLLSAIGGDFISLQQWAERAQCDISGDDFWRAANGLHELGAVEEDGGLYWLADIPEA